MNALARIFASPPIADAADEYLIFLSGQGTHGRATGLKLTITRRVVSVPYRKRIWIDAETKRALSLFGVPMVVLEQR